MVVDGSDWAVRIETVLESIKCGARDFVVKPFQADRVIEAVGKALT